MTVEHTSINTYLNEVKQSLDQLPIDVIETIVASIRTARDNGNTVYVFGNGGSAATATHMASDLAKGAIQAGKPRIRAFSLTDNVSLVSAWSNDDAYENVFSEQLEGFIGKGDVAVGISGSGKSRNVINGINKAKEKGAVTIGLIGYDGGSLKESVDIPLVVNNYDMRQVEDIHLIIEHIVTMCLQESD